MSAQCKMRSQARVDLFYYYRRDSFGMKIRLEEHVGVYLRPKEIWCLFQFAKVAVRSDSQCNVKFKTKIKIIKTSYRG